jgi:hypothetical protein
LLTLDSKVIQASTICFAAKKRSLIDKVELEPTPKRLCNHSMHESWREDDTKLIQDTLKATIEEDIPKAEVVPS